MKFLFNWDENFSKKKAQMEKNPNPKTDIELYVPAYDYPQMTYLNKQSVLMKVSCEYPDCREKKYYEESALVAKYDFEIGSLTKLMGAYPPCYQTELFTPAFANHYYTAYRKNEYLLSFGIDSLLYVCDENFKPKRAFGLAGKIVNNNYARTNLKKIRIEKYNFEKEEKTKGHYTSIFYCKREDLTFRIYKTGILTDDLSEDLDLLNNPSRMQIYKGDNLVGDVDVPDDFEIIAYVTPYFYADGYAELGEVKDRLGFYKFKIEL